MQPVLCLCEISNIADWENYKTQLLLQNHFSSRYSLHILAFFSTINKPKGPVCKKESLIFMYVHIFHKMFAYGIEED